MSGHGLGNTPDDEVRGGGRDASPALCRHDTVSGRWSLILVSGAVAGSRIGGLRGHSARATDKGIPNASR